MKKTSTRNKEKEIKNRQGTEKKEIDNKRKTKLKAEKKQKFEAVPEHGTCRSCRRGRDWSLRRKDKSLRNRKRLEFALGKTKRKKGKHKEKSIKRAGGLILR